MAHKRAKLDSWSLKAQKEGYPARSVYKLQEIDQKCNLIQKGYKVLDVGASPGSWTLYVLRKLQKSGLVAAVDLKPLSLKGNHPHLQYFQGDIFSEEAGNFLNERGPYQLVISDAAPNTTGNRLVDTRRSYDLVERVLNLAAAQLDKDGAFVAKVFQGGDEEELFLRMKEMFRQTRRIKPKAVRPESFETYFVGQGFIG